MLEMELRGGRLKVPQLRVSGDDGFSLELEGDLDNVAVRPKGVLRAVVGAENARAIAPLAELLGIPTAFRPSAARAQAMVPLRVAGTMTLAARTPTSADVVVDGEVNGGAMKLNARLDGGAGGWRTGPADVTGLVEAADLRVIASLLLPGRPQASAATGAPGRLLVKSSGVPAQGLASLATVEAGDLDMRFRGQLVAAEAGNSAMGELELKARDGARMAALVGLASPLWLDGVPVAGSLQLAATSGKVAMDKLALNIGGGRLAGQLSVAEAGERRRVEAHLVADELSVPQLLRPLLDSRLAAAEAAEAVVAGQQSPWPDEPFEGSILDAYDGSISLAAKRLVLAEGISLADAGIDIVLARGKVEASRIEGGCMGGRCSATLRFDKVPAGVELSGQVRLTGASLEFLATGGGDKPRSSGTMSGQIKFSGKGTSPRSVLSVLQGSGSLEFGDGKLAALWPGAITAAAEAALKSEPDKLAAVVKEAITAGLTAGQLPLPGSVALAIADGQLTVKPFSIETPEGRAEGSASLDLRSLAFESEWRLNQKPPAPGEKPPLPPVTLVYRGPAASIGSIEPRISTEALERELAVRRMERDVEELERLRKLDEARRREEAERQRHQLEQTPEPAPAPAPVPVAPVEPQPRAAAPG